MPGWKLPGDLLTEPLESKEPILIESSCAMQYRKAILRCIHSCWKLPDLNHCPFSWILFHFSPLLFLGTSVSQSEPMAFSPSGAIGKVHCRSHMCSKYCLPPELQWARGWVWMSGMWSPLTILTAFFSWRSCSWPLKLLWLLRLLWFTNCFIGLSLWSDVHSGKGWISV